MQNSAEYERPACSCTLVRVRVRVEKFQNLASGFVVLLNVRAGGPPSAGPMASSPAPRSRLNVYGVIDSAGLGPDPSRQSNRGGRGISVRLDWNDYCIWW